MSKIARLTAVAVIVCAPLLAAATSTTALADGIGWDHAPATATAAVTAVAATAQTNGIGWD